MFSSYSPKIVHIAFSIYNQYKSYAAVIEAFDRIGEDTARSESDSIDYSYGDDSSISEAMQATGDTEMTLSINENNIGIIECEGDDSDGKLSEINDTDQTILEQRTEEDTTTLEHINAVIDTPEEDIEIDTQITMTAIIFLDTEPSPLILTVIDAIQNNLKTIYHISVNFVITSDLSTITSEDLVFYFMIASQVSRFDGINVNTFNTLVTLTNRNVVIVHILQHGNIDLVPATIYPADYDTGIMINDEHKTYCLRYLVNRKTMQYASCKQNTKNLCALAEILDTKNGQYTEA